MPRGASGARVASREGSRALAGPGVVSQTQGMADVVTPHPCHVTAHRAGFPFGTTTITSEGGAHDCGVDFSIVKQRRGEVLEDRSSHKETAWVLLDGRARTSVDGVEHAVTRASLFDERPSVLHVPSREPVRLTAETDVEWARVRTSNARSFPPSLFLPESTSSEARGKGLAHEASLRVVRLVFGFENRPESNLVIGEVVHLAGRWSSYPPHHHDQPELYHYRFTEPQGYGHAELGEHVVKVKHNDSVKILDGVDHPQVAAPGYGMYYLWIVRHQLDNPYRGFTYAPEHQWILDGQRQGWAPRLTNGELL